MSNLIIAFLAFLGGVVGALIGAGAKFWISLLGRRQQFKLAALEKRLDIYQQAFALNRKLLSSVHKDDKGLLNVANSCDEWFGNNCLYLDADIREAFRESYLSAAKYPGLLTSYKLANSDNREHARNQLYEYWSKIEAPLKLIPGAVSLPAITPPLEIIDEKGKVIKLDMDSVLDELA